MDDAPNQAQGFTNIMVVGPRGSGKTTYLRGLSILEDKKEDFKNNDQLNLELDWLNAATKKLRQDAINILKLSEAPSPTPKGDVIKYGFQLGIEYPYINKKQAIGFKGERITVAVTDYPGEDFEETLDSVEENDVKLFAQKKEAGFMLLLSDWDQDESISNYIINFRDALKYADNYDCHLRFAVVMNKCEKGEFWTFRQDPHKSIFRKHFKSCTKEVEKLADIAEKVDIKFFALSTYGVRDTENNDFRPNRKDFKTIENGSEKIVSAIRYPDKWYPYGMLSPIYWLATGRSLPPHV